MTFAQCLHDFFNTYLPKIKGGSANTVKSYRDAFTLFLTFSSEQCHCEPNSLELEHVSTDLILDFLEYLETNRKNITRTRNLRLAAFKSLAKMIRLIYPEMSHIADRFLSLPQKRVQKKMIGFLTQQEVMQVFKTVDLKKARGFRDYTILHLLYDSGARASEVASLNLDYFDPKSKTLAILGKGDRYRLIELWPKTVDLLTRYIKDYRTIPRLYYSYRLFINQRGGEFTRHGIYRICKKYLEKALPTNRLLALNPAHSFRHSCAMNMLATGSPITDIKNRLGHENIQSTMAYLQVDLTRKRDVQKKFIAYTQSLLGSDPKLDELVDRHNKEEILKWLSGL